MDKEISTPASEILGFPRRLYRGMNPDQLFEMGRDLLYGFDRQRIDYEKAVEYIKESAGNGHVLANGVFAVLLGAGNVIPRDQDSFRILCDSRVIKNDLVYLANTGHPIAQTTVAALGTLGFRLDDVHAFQEKRRAWRLFGRTTDDTIFDLNLSAADQGCAEAFFRLAHCFTLMKKDGDAVNALREAARRGVALAQWKLGELHSGDHHLGSIRFTRDADEAAFWQGRARAQGYVPPAERSSQLIRAPTQSAPQSG